MAINWDKEYGTSEPKKSKINWEKEYNPTGFKERIDTEKADLRSKGLPVSVRDDRSAPTMGGSILRDILKVPATLLARPGQAIGAIQGLTPEEQTVKSKYLGDIKTVQTGKDVLSDVGRGLELASYGVGIGAGKNILAQSGKQAAKQIAKRTALEGAVGGFAGSAGRVITNQSGNLKQDLKDIALGTGIGTIAGGALGYAGGRLGGKVLSAEERAMERAVGKGGKFNIPSAGTPKITEIVNKDTKLAKELSQEIIPKEQILKESDDLIWARGTKAAGIQNAGLKNYNQAIKTLEKAGELPKETKMKIVSKDTLKDFYTNKKTPVVGDTFINSKNEVIEITQVNDKDITYFLKGKNKGISGKIYFDEPFSNKVSKETPVQSIKTQPEVLNNTPEFKSKVSEGETVLNNSNPEINPGTHKMYSETVYSDIATDPERVRRIAMGSNEPTTNGVPADAYYAIAKNEAVKSGNVQAIKDLANSNVGSISGQKLEANKLTQEGDIIDTLRDIKKARAKAVGVSEEAIKKQETTFVQKLKTSVKNLSDDIINDLICK